MVELSLLAEFGQRPHAMLKVGFREWASSLRTPASGRQTTCGTDGKADFPAREWKTYKTGVTAEA